MPGYTAPLRDHRFCLTELFDYSAHATLPGFADASEDVALAVLEQAGKFCEEVVHPLNEPGDRHGCQMENGAVVMAPGFKQAYAKLCDGGWPSLTAASGHGGQSMPHMVNFLFEEMLAASSLSFCLFPGLTRGAYVTIAKHGDAAQLALYAPRLASGEWTGSMCLTEPQCGTDLGLIKTTARPMPDGSHAISGTKIFITCGEHDLASNIIYLVLAKLPDAPPGSRGISLFIVPKFITDADGKPLSRNAVSCVGLEEKLGIHACPTCVMQFEGATGWLLGEPHQGLKAMFSMMNAERIAVGIQGLGLAEASYQNALRYARERRQGRASSRKSANVEAADPIIVHPDVRRMLLTQKALIEGCRALALWTAEKLDQSEHHPDPAIRQQADDFVSLMTPVVKAFLTDCGSEIANLGVQILGGHGYIRANGQEQLLRDVRITQIYEGTNGIQALDLMSRKVLGQEERLFAGFATPVAKFIAANYANPALLEFVAPLADALARLTRCTEKVKAAASRHPDEVAAAATDYLKLFGLTALAYLWARMAEVSLPRSNEPFYRAKLETARFYMQRILPQSLGLEAAILAGAASLMAMEEADF